MAETTNLDKNTVALELEQLERPESETHNIIESSNEESTKVQLKSHRKFTKHKINNELKEKLIHIPEAVKYIDKLERTIEKHLCKIIKLRNKLKRKSEVKDIATQTDNNLDNEQFEDTSGNSQNLVKSITDDIKEAAELATQNSGFVYEETSGLYYDYNTGYYYNAEYGLYYDGNTGTYLKYNQETATYEFHSQVSSASTKINPEITDKPTKRKNNKKEKIKDVKRPKSKEDRRREVVEDNDGIEEGEICSDVSDCSDDASDVEIVSDSSDVSRSWPPCMRIMVISSDNPKIKTGTLHIVTCDGGTIGREGTNHSVILPDINVSKHHLRFEFDKESGRYLAVDLGSRNGTFLNSKRMAPSKMESEPMEVAHGSKIQIGGTVLMCHIHEGGHTCGHCEPGLFEIREEAPEKIEKLSMSAKHKNELKKLKKQCGLIGSGDGHVKLATGYTDRAQKRRETIGSQNPHEKTQAASVDESIDSGNKGFKLLAKMGWKEGQSLGKSGDGLKEPVKVVGNCGTTGIGAEATPSVAIGDSSKKSIWKRAQERFDKLPVNPTFDVSDEED